MAKRTSYEIRREILYVLKDGEEHSLGYLERKVDTNWQTVRTHCKDLELFNAITKTDKGIKITKEGRELLKRL